MAEFTAYDVIFIALTIGGLFITGIILNKKLGKTKSKTVREDLQSTSVKTAKEQLIDMKEFYGGQIEALKKELTSWKGKYYALLRQSQPELEDDENMSKPTRNTSVKNLENEYEIDISKALPLLDSFNLPFNIDKSKIPALLNNPLIKGKVWEYIKKNKDEMISLEIIVPKGTIQNTQQDAEVEDSNPTGMLNLSFDQTNSKYMA